MALSLYKLLKTTQLVLLKLKLGYVMSAMRSTTKFDSGFYSSWFLINKFSSNIVRLIFNSLIS